MNLTSILLLLQLAVSLLVSVQTNPNATAEQKNQALSVAGQAVSMSLDYVSTNPATKSAPVSAPTPITPTSTPTIAPAPIHNKTNVSIPIKGLYCLATCTFSGADACPGTCTVGPGGTTKTMYCPSYSVCTSNGAGGTERCPSTCMVAIPKSNNEPGFYLAPIGSVTTVTYVATPTF